MITLLPRLMGMLQSSDSWRCHLLRKQPEVGLDAWSMQGKSMLQASLAPLPSAPEEESTAASPGPSAALNADVIDLTDSPPGDTHSKRQRLHSPRPASPQGAFRGLRRLVRRG